MIKLRPHHLVCIPRFYRGGYDKKFAKNMKKICLIIRKNPNIKIKIVSRLDDLCEECPHKYKKGCIQSKKMGKWVVNQDRKVVRYLKIKQNSVYTAKEIFNLSMNKIGSKDVEKICHGCIFLKNCAHVGINKSFQKEVNKK